jgi:radical SAM protein with 4Fe4S-binding SPASM domain
VLKYDLTDLGYEYKGAATVASKEMKFGPWNIIDIPKDIDDKKVYNEVKLFLNKICAIEIPTSLKCNLRCRYCYIDDLRMKNKDVSKIDVEKILQESSKMFPGMMRENLHDKNKAHLTSWGAEPFVNINTLESMYEYCHEYYGKDKYQLGLSTNGTIWTDRIKQLIINLYNDGALKEIQISLDGPPDVQNKNRPYVNGKPSFDSVKDFTLNFIDLMTELKVKENKHHFCSTIHLQDDDFVNMWIESAKFFSEPNQWYTSPYLPMRMSGEDMYGEKEINKFIEAQKQMVDVVKERVKNGIPIFPFYTSKLFGDISCKSKNANPFCSAMNTQIGIDLDGSLYPCHGPITSPTYKPWLWFGNLFDKTISYKKLIRNIYYQYNNWNRAKCTSCLIYHYSSGSICWSCGSHNLSVSGEPTIDNIMKCKAYNKSFPYWVEIAKMTVNNPILDEIPMNVDIELKKKIKFNPQDGHYDRNYDGIIQNSSQKICQKSINNIENMYYDSQWWDFDDFFEEVIGE